MARKITPFMLVQLVGRVWNTIDPISYKGSLYSYEEQQTIPKAKLLSLTLTLGKAYGAQIKDLES